MNHKANYSELLKDPRWQKLRLQVFERDEWTCQKCRATDRTLAVHHKQYQQGKKPWEYPLCWLVTVCEACHQEEYEYRKEAEGILLEVFFNIAGFWSDDVYNFACSLANPDNQWFGYKKETILEAFSWMLRNAPNVPEIAEARTALMSSYLEWERKTRSAEYGFPEG